MRGDEYANLIAAYVAANYGSRGLTVYREVPLGKTIIGKNRRVDILCLHEATSRLLTLECKYQNVSGTAEEKIPYTLSDLRAMHVPAFAVYAGEGFSQGVLHMLQASEIAAHCWPAADLKPSSATLELDHIVAMTFGWWDAVLANKKAFDLGSWRAAHQDRTAAGGTRSQTAPTPRSSGRTIGSSTSREEAVAPESSGPSPEPQIDAGPTAQHSAPEARPPHKS